MAANSGGRGRTLLVSLEPLRVPPATTVSVIGSHIDELGMQPTKGFEALFGAHGATCPKLSPCARCGAEIEALFSGLCRFMSEADPPPDLAYLRSFCSNRSGPRRPTVVPTLGFR